MAIASLEELSSFCDPIDRAIALDFIMDQHVPNELTQTSISMWLSCQQKFILRHIYGLRKQSLPKHRITGTLFHHGLERILKMARETMILTDDQITEAMREIETSMDAEVDRISTESCMVSPWDVENIEYCRVQSLAMVEAWARTQLSRFMQFKIIGVEQTFRSLGVGPLLHMGAGKIDGIVELNGDLYVLEHKTRARMDTLNTGYLSMDLQANWYMALAASRLGRPIKGFIYNAVKKPQHRMSAKGLGSEELRKRMVAAMMADADGYFALIDIIADAADVQRNLDNMTKVVMAILKTGQKDITMNPTACEQYGGCEYRALCSNGADVCKPITIKNNIELSQFEFAPNHTELETIEDA